MYEKKIILLSLTTKKMRWWNTWRMQRNLVIYP